jgi:Flp pilus assembly protein TadB
MGKALLLVGALCVAAAAGGAQQNASKAKPAAARATAETHSQVAAANEQRREAMQADLRRMRALLEQMQNNLGFVQSGATPLKHQFELEIEMWRALLGHMERNMQPGSAPVK